MNKRPHGYVLLVFTAVFCLLTVARAGAGDWYGEKPPKEFKEPKEGKEGKEPKEQPDQRVLSSLRDYLECSDAEWQTLLPHVTQVQTLTRELRELRGGGRTFDIVKPAKPAKDSDASASAASTSSSSAAFADAMDKARELRNLLADKSADASRIRGKLDDFRKARAQADKLVAQDLADARTKLIELLTARQELACVVSGLLD